MEQRGLGWWQTRAFVAALTLVATIPLLWPDIPPLVDVPGHMGRFRVQLSWDQYPWLRNWYAFQWQLIGNLGVDLLVIPLEHLVGLEWAVKLIVLTIPAFTVAGLLWIAREVHGRIPPHALFALPLAYSFPFQFGFINFALSMGLALCLFALWLRLARQGRLEFRAAVFVPLSCALWVCHTFGWGVLGVLAFSAELIRQHDRKPQGWLGWPKAWIRAGLGCAPLALPIVLMALWRSGDHVTGQTGDWFNWHAKLQWLTMIFRDRWLWWDTAALAVIVLVLVKALRDPRVGYSRNLGLSALALLAVFVLLPRIVFGSAYADMRLAPFMIAVAVLAVRPKAEMTLRHQSVIAALGLAFFVARIAGTTISYWQFDRVYDRQLAALDHVPVGARLVTFYGQSCANPWMMSRMEHMAALALVRRAAYSNDQWSMPGAQLLTVRYRAARGFSHDPSEIVTPFQCSREWWRPVNRALLQFPRDAFDYVWMIRPPSHDQRMLQGLVPVWRDGTSAVYRVDHSVPPPVYDPATMPKRFW
jgi:hypothetical protein